MSESSAFTLSVVTGTWQQGGSYVHLLRDRARRRCVRLLLDKRPVLFVLIGCKLFGRA